VFCFVVPASIVGIDTYLCREVSVLVCFFAIAPGRRADLKDRVAIIVDYVAVDLLTTTASTDVFVSTSSRVHSNIDQLVYTPKVAVELRTCASYRENCKGEIIHVSEFPLCANP
jgi:hypothetical protein